MPVRLIAASVSVLAVIGLCIDAWRLAASDSIVVASNSVLEGASWLKSSPSLEPWLLVRNDLLEAQRLTPTSPGVLESLGVLHARRAPSPEFLVYARDYFLGALELRPTSPYTWANYSEARYLIGETGPGFERALRRAAELGPWEPGVQRVVANLGLAVIDDVQPDTRRAITTSIAFGMRANPLETLQIAERRGRLDIACRHVAGNARVKDPSWIQRCEKENK